MLHIYNTLSRKKEKFKPLRQEEVKIYFCGPTVYNYAHIWNLRTFVFEDYVIKTLKFLWYKVRSTMNITDIDDKTIKWSIEANIKLSEFTKKYTDIFINDIKKLNINPADNIVPISTLLDEMVLMINGLLKKGYAYYSDDGSIYYDIKKFKKYWNLANLDFSWMKESVRIDNDEYDKESASDFVLWKAYKKEDWENYWEKEFKIWDKVKILKWRPWWHIECSACNLKYFWAQIDIHMWGVDLVFPHHQNEIAQSEAYTWKQFSKYWIHSGHLMVDWKKMSKSLWNFYTLKDLEEKFSNINKSVLYRAIRLSFMNAKYRESVDFSFSKLEANFNTIKKIDESIKKLQRALDSDLKERLPTKKFREEMQYYIWEYVKKLEDDFNMPEALSVFFDFISFANSSIDSNNLSKSEANSLLDMYKTFNDVLSIIEFDKEKSEIPAEIMKIFEDRNNAKAKKDFETADKLRDKLLELGYKIIDDRSWSFLEKI